MSRRQQRKMNHGENKKGALEENTGGDIYSPPEDASHTILLSTVDRRPDRGPRTRERATLLPIMATPEERVKGWMTVDKQQLWGAAGPFDELVVVGNFG